MLVSLMCSAFFMACSFGGVSLNQQDLGYTNIDVGVEPQVLDDDVTNETTVVRDSAYLGSFSVAQGEAMEVYVSTDQEFYMELRQLGVTNVLRWNHGPYQGTLHESPVDNAWKASLDWGEPVDVPISEHLESGYYQIAVYFRDGGLVAMQFVVKEDEPGSTSPLLVLDNATTRVAYNNWGGKSTYSFNSSDKASAQVVSLRRPGQYIVKNQQMDFLRWADSADITLEWASSMDWHDDPELFESYETIVLVEHSEYWSKEMRDAVDRHLARGGNLLSMSGNTAWWQVRFEDEKMLAYKWGPSDPMYGVNDDVVTTNFYKPPLNNPENSTIGVSYLNGGYHNNDGHYMAADGYGGYEVSLQDHPLFAGTGLRDGDFFGTEATIVGYEADGALFTMVDGTPIVTGEDGTPPTMEILATAPAKTPNWDGTATMVAGSVGENGGQIINMATVDWADGLWNKSTGKVRDPVVGKITLNAIEQLSPGAGAECNGMCHPSPSDYNDADGDGHDDKCDSCVMNPGEMLDSDWDGTGDVCEAS